MRWFRQMLMSCRLKSHLCCWSLLWWARSTSRLLRNKRSWMVPLSWYLIFSAALFSIGLFGVLSRRNAVAILLGIELMLNSVNVNLAAFWRYGDVADITGQVFAIIVFAVAAAEVAVGWGWAVAVFPGRT